MSRRVVRATTSYRAQRMTARMTAYRRSWSAGRKPEESSPTAAGWGYAIRASVGFNLADAHKLFAPFQRFHTAAEFEGSGIGLATVHRIVRRHGGHIRARSAPGEGTTFFFTLGK